MNLNFSKVKITLLTENNQKKHANIILSHSSNISNMYDLYGFDLIKKFDNQNNYLISSFCNIDTQLKCWAELIKKKKYFKEQQKKFNVLKNHINKFDSICIFAKSRHALSANYLIKKINEKTDLTIILISPVISPFDLKEFKKIKFAKETIDHFNMQIETNYLRNNLNFIASTNEIDQRVNEKNLFNLAKKRKDNFQLFVNYNAIGHTNYVPKLMIEAVSKSCG